MEVIKEFDTRDIVSDHEPPPPHKTKLSFTHYHSRVMMTMIIG